MAADDAERRGKRRWFRILGSPEAARTDGDELPENEDGST